MFLNNNIKYKNMLIFVLIAIVGYKLIDNYSYFFKVVDKGISILTPFIYALICAYVLNPIVNGIEKKFHINRGISILITYIMLIAVIFIILFFTIPSLVNSIINITAEIPMYITKSQEWINEAIKNERIHELISQAGLLNNIKDLAAQIGNISMDILQGSAKYLVSMTSNVVNVVLGFLISIYVLADKDKLLKIVRTITFMVLREKNGERVINFVRIYNKMIGTYVGIKAIDSAIIGTISLIGLLILRVPYAPLLAVVVGITNMIPYFGPLVGIIVSGTVTIFSSLILSIIVMIMLLCLQQFDAWYLEPKLVGKKVGVSPLAIIFGVTLGGGILGPIGMILGSPTMATVRIYYHKIFAKFKAKNEELVKKEGLDSYIEEIKSDKDKDKKK
ncbi:AI-2E family transporter [Clostridium sp. SM-530-WT-3G]|uniref:AI-2E family transporter n=1 Tax=Clostridium sp. SM-530-WT-3G TaxID=2725303 RepID=UPI00145F9DB2|nr:AI-2E family transporter [Clostridium sp. SM-530-WT-3G]NME82430.1 AI-2E family transporter [Clostridium sp. SM-530-WT-3G]